MGADTCLRCGGTKLEAGDMAAFGNFTFRPEGARFLTLRNTYVQVRTRMCLDCGTMDLVGDADRCRELVEDARKR